MIDFSRCVGWTIPEGNVVQVADAGGRVLWRPEGKLPGTFYLRPSADIYLSSNITLTPADAAAAYLLINEEEHDDDSTKIALVASETTGDLSGSAKFSVGGDVPQKITKVTNFDLVVSARHSTLYDNDNGGVAIPGMGSTFSVDLAINGVVYSCVFEGGNDQLSGFENNLIFDTKEATHFYLAEQYVSKETMLAEINSLLSINGVLPDIELTFNMTAFDYVNSANNKTGYGYVYVTQAYIALECE